jgi:hypothetical protein
VLQYEFTSSLVHISSPLVGFSVGLMVVSVELLVGLLVVMLDGLSVVVLSVVLSVDGLVVDLSK